MMNSLALFLLKLKAFYHQCLCWMCPLICQENGFKDCAVGVTEVYKGFHWCDTYLLSENKNNFIVHLQ